MKRELIILLAAVTLSMAMVPRLRRAVNMDDDADFKKSNSTAVNFCLPQTPCAWSVYKSHTKIIETNIINSYCTCGPDMMCLASGEDLNHGGMVHYCNPPVNEDTSES